VAISQAEEYDKYHKDWVMTFPDVVQSQYYKELEAWENNSSLPNPFEKMAMSKFSWCMHFCLYKTIVSSDLTSTSLETAS
jgi:hypothetical protein